MWKVESEKYDEEFELMKKEFEVCPISAPMSPCFT